MAQADPDTEWTHLHLYGRDTAHAERRTRWVIGITAAMMVLEIAAGTAFHSMSLLADGWHMSTHVAAFLITAAAYYYGRRHAQDVRYTFGTGKMGVLGGFASAVVLAVVAVLMAGESIHRLFAPESIRFNEAIIIALLGLLVNALCAWLLKADPAHHPHDHDHHHHEGADLNQRAAYLHVLADALTSVGAIAALLAGKFFGWAWLDATAGLLGSLVVAVWAWGLLRETSGVLLDCVPKDSKLPSAVRQAVESDGDARVTDLHLWQVAEEKYAAILFIVAHAPHSADTYRARLQGLPQIVHITVEVHPRGERGTSTASEVSAL